MWCQNHNLWAELAQAESFGIQPGNASEFSLQGTCLAGHLSLLWIFSLIGVAERCEECVQHIVIYPRVAYN
jgi:hypothetical protein